MASTKNLEILKEENYPSFTGKLLVTSLTAWMLGKNLNVKVRGTKDEMRVVENVLSASKTFQEELNRPGATIASINEKLTAKRTAAAEFERVVGVPWLL